MDIVTYALCRKLIKTSIETLGDVFTLKGNVASVGQLPSSGNKPGDIYLVGPNQQGSYDEYYWTSGEDWEVMGSTGPNYDDIITKQNLYEGDQGTGTVENPAQGTILYEVNNNFGNYVSKTGDVMTGPLTTTKLVVGTGTASGNGAVAEGSATVATGTNSHAEGCATNATNYYSHAEGYGTKASGDSSHAEGDNTVASGSDSHTEGHGSIASGTRSHAEGYYTIAQRTSQNTIGEYNIADSGGSAGAKGSYVHIVGNGTAENARSNAHTLDWQGNAWFSGDVYVNSTSGTNKDAGSKKLATEDTFIGTDGTTVGVKGLVPAPTTSDENKYLKSDGTWSEISEGTSYTAGDYIDITNNEISVDGIVSQTKKEQVELISGYHWENIYEDSIPTKVSDSYGKYAKIENSTSTDMVLYLEYTGSNDNNSLVFITDENNVVSYDSGTYSSEKNRKRQVILHPNEILYLNFEETNVYPASVYKYTFAIDASITNKLEGKSTETPIGEEVQFDEYGEGMDCYYYTNTTEEKQDIWVEIVGWWSDYRLFTHADKNGIVKETTFATSYNSYTEDDPLLTAGTLLPGETLYMNIIGDGSPSPEVKIHYSPSAVLDNYTKFTDIFVGTDGWIPGKAGIVPAPTPTDENKFLKSDGTWSIPGGSGYVLKTGDTMTGKLTTPSLSVGVSNTVSDGCTGEGNHVEAMNLYSHAEGYYTHATGKYSHAEGDYSTASGEDAHAEGYTTVAQARYTHAEGNSTDALSQSQHVQGEWNVQDHTGSNTTRGTYAHIIGNGSGENARSNAATVKWNGEAWFAGDVYVGSTSGTNKDNGSKKLATDDTFGGTDGTNAGTKGLVPAPTASDTDKYLKSDGTWATVSGGSGNYVLKTGDTMTGTLIVPSINMGSNNTITSGVANAFISGVECTVNEYAGHAEGWGCTVGTGSGEAEAAHAEGLQTQAIGFSSHSEGYQTYSGGQYSHAEGYGSKTELSADYSHAEGYYTIAGKPLQHVEGKYNVSDTAGTYAHIVGGGTGSSAANRKNIHTLDWNGNGWFLGDVYVYSTGGKNKDSGSKKLATENYVTLAISNAIGGVTSFEYQVVQSLPAMGQTGIIYLLPQSGGSAQNTYDEYIWTSSAYELIGSTELNLANYVQTEDLANYVQTTDLADYVRIEDLESITESEIIAAFA